MKKRISAIKLFLIGILGQYIYFPLLLLITYNIVDKDGAKNKITVVVTALVIIGLLNTLYFARNLRYYYQIQLLQLITSSLVALMLFIVSLELMSSIGTGARIWTLAGTCVSLIFIIRSLRNEPIQWDLARKQGRLRKYINEETWTYAFEIPNTVEKVFQEMDKENKRNNLFSFLERIHFLMPAIGMALSRDFPNQRIALIMIAFLFMGLIFTSQVKIPLYAKTREWERERGKRLLLQVFLDRE